MSKTKNKEQKTNGEAGKEAESKQGKPRVISNPNDVASLVLMQIDAVNAKKDDLTIAIKGLTDTTKQLVRAYAENMKAIQALQERVIELEDKTKSN